MTIEQLLHRLGEVRDAIEIARSAQDTATLFHLTAERDKLRTRLQELQQPTRGEIEAELEGLRSQLAAFDPETGMLTGMNVGGVLEMGHAANFNAAQKAEQQQRDDAGVTNTTQRIAYLEEKLAKLD